MRTEGSETFHFGPYLLTRVCIRKMKKKREKKKQGGCRGSLNVAEAKVVAASIVRFRLPHLKSPRAPLILFSPLLFFRLLFFRSNIHNSV